MSYEQWMEDRVMESTLTSCEFYGHNFETDEEDPSKRYCVSCGDEYVEQ